MTASCVHCVHCVHIRNSNKEKKTHTKGGCVANAKSRQSWRICAHLALTLFLYLSLIRHVITHMTHTVYRNKRKQTGTPFITNTYSVWVYFFFVALLCSIHDFVCVVLLIAPRNIEWCLDQMNCVEYIVTHCAPRNSPNGCHPDKQKKNYTWIAGRLSHTQAHSYLNSCVFGWVHHNQWVMPFCSEFIV